MDLFILDKIILKFLLNIGPERLFFYSLFGLGITNTLYTSTADKRLKK